MIAIIARTDFDHTITLPNYVSMLTGRPVNDKYGQSGSGHQWTTNVTPPLGTTLHTNAGYYVASAFDVAHDNGLSTGLYATKEKFVLFENSYNAANGAPDTTGADNGRDKIDVYVNYDLDSGPMMSELVSNMTSSPTHYTFVHFHDTDTAEHAYGWGSTEYRNALVTVDGYLGQILGVATSGAMNGNTTIILTTDHGGSGLGHFDETDPVNYTIPFFMWGGVPANVDLYAMNGGDTADPGTSHVDYALGSGQPIRNGDSRNCSLRRLSLPAIPNSSVDHMQTACGPNPIIPPTVTPTTTPSGGSATLVAAGSAWKYLDDGSNQGTAWQSPTFNDAAWASGSAPLGYGDPMSTIVNGGPANNRFITTYFRRNFTVADPAQYTNLTLYLRRDDGAVVYLNGAEVARSNMPAGAVNYATFANQPCAGGTDETSFFPFSVPISVLTAGNNVLAVEIHQCAPDSTDLGFDLRLDATTTSVATATSTSTSTPTATNTPAPSTATPTGTPSPTPTNTSVPSTPTSTPTPTPTPTNTAVASTATATSTPTNTPVPPTATATPTQTPSPTPTPSTMLIVADAHVRGGTNANTNYGNVQTLEVREDSNANNDRWTYLKFDTSSVTGSIGNVTLRVFGQLSASGSLGIGVYTVSDTSWSEGGITWNNKPATSASSIVTINTSGTTYTWYEVDVTSYVLAERAAGRNVVSFALRIPANNSRTFSVRSEEYNSGNNEARLIMAR